MPAFLPILAAGGISAAANLASGLASRTKVSQVDQARLRELERLEALGKLGLSDEDLAALRAQRLAPVQAQGAEMQRRLLAAQAPGGGGAGAFAAQALAGQDQQNQVVAAASRDIMAYDAAERGRQQEEARALAQSLEAQRDARRRETTQAIIGAVDSGIQSAFSAGMGAPKIPAPGTAIPEADLSEIQKFMASYGQGRVV